jgi:hypothetical protein
MIRARHLSFHGVAALLIAVVLGACNKPSPQASLPPSPEESFKFIVDTIRRSIESTSGGVFAPSGGGYTALSMRYAVVDEYLPPHEANESPRGRITIEEESEVTIQPAQRGDDEMREADDRDNAASGGSLQSPSARSQTRSGEGPSFKEAPLPRTNKASKVFELVRKNDRWELATEINREKDPAVFEAFDYALKTQL